ncbi:glycosyltransferase [Jeotgalibaca ciconiae]|uniref:Glycosyltransferase n=1 Tax=Jeotgalibaca ciconiae TaxID=2496265 RepID=A0A3S9HC09_9LACT|nr:glycosyltransferase [Jeotgalibaca ciconiae]AZP04908.1 glycosyltransferase [Jeotgalibaca ciconiae]
MKVKVSVIMSEYNTEKDILEQAIKSILNQTFKDFEFIIVNDGKHKTLSNLLETINDKRIILIENGENIGLAKSLNKAIEASKGKYLVRMDTDDIAHSNRIEKLVEFIEKNPQYSVVGSSVNILNEKNEKIKKQFIGEITKRELMDRKAPVHPSVLMKKNDVCKVGGYRTKNVQRCEDFVLWAELLLNKYRIFIVEDVLLDYRVRLIDYKKRKLSTRRDEILNRLKYYKLLKATPVQYVTIWKSVVAGFIPHKIIAWYHRQGG